MELDFFFNLFT